MSVSLDKPTDTPNVRIIRVRFLEDDVYDGAIPMASFDNAITETYESDRSVDSTEDIIEYAVRMLQAEGLTFASTGNEWAANPDGTTIVDYATGEREDTSGHLNGYTDAERAAIMERVG